MIIVTGANGFIGSSIVWELNKQGFNDIVCVDSVALADRPELLAKKKYSKFLLKNELWDFLNLETTKKSVEWIIHMGANSSTTETNWEHLYENNTFYSQRIFEWCTQNDKKIIYASSAATYGSGSLGFNDETDHEQLVPLNLYGKSKVIFDQWTTRQPRLPNAWYGLKFFNVYGPNEYHKGSMSSIVYKAFHQIQDTGQLKLFKSYLSDYRDGEQMRDFVYVKDVTNWILEIMKKNPPHGIYNMGFGKARTWLDLAQSTFQAMGRPVQIQFIEMPNEIKGQYQYFTEANMNKWLAAKLSQPQWSIENGISDYVKNYLLKADRYL